MALATRPEVALELPTAFDPELMLKDPMISEGVQVLCRLANDGLTSDDDVTVALMQEMGDQAGLDWMTMVFAGDPVPVPSSAPHVAAHLVRLHAGERVRQLAEEATARGEAAVDPEDVLDIADTLAELEGDDDQGKRVWQQILDDAAEGKAAPEAIPTGVRALDREVQIRPGHLVVIGGNPGQGKSSLLVSMAVAAAQAGRRVLFLTAEMTAREVALRLACSIAGLPAKELLPDLPRLEAATRAAAELPLTIEPVGSVMDVVRLLRRHEPDMACVDFLQLLEHAGTTRQSREERVAGSVWRLAKTARDLEVALILASQYSRQQVSYGAQRQRGERLPVMSDLRESGAIEQAASTVLMLATPTKPETWRVWQAPAWMQAVVEEHEAAGWAIPQIGAALHVAKQRHGRAGVLVWLRTDFAVCRIRTGADEPGSEAADADGLDDVPF